MIKGKGQRLIPEELLKYFQNQKDKGMNIVELVDSAGNPRFVEGDGEGLTQEGVTISYCKWSLSGTHLMLVCAGTVASGTTISTGTGIGVFGIPKWIYDKIYSLFSNVVEIKNFNYWGSDYTSQSSITQLQKVSNTLKLSPTGNLTTTANRNFRIQFDLLIDSE